MSDSPQAIPRWRHVALAFLMFLTTATFGFVQPFVPLYMEASGLARSQIGVAMGLATGTALFVQPFLGHLSDRWDSRRLPMALAGLVAGCAYLSFPYAAQAWMFFALYALGMNSVFYLNAAGGALVGRMITEQAQGGASYVRYRVWGSIGYIFVSLGAGWLLGIRSGASALGRENIGQIFVWGSLLFFGICGVALTVYDPKHRPVATPSNQAAPKSNLLTPNLRYFLLAYFLYSFSLYGASAYLSLYLKQLGASPVWLTGAFAAGVLCEVLVMGWVGRWTDRFGRRPALAVAFLILPVRLLLYIPATGPLWILAVQTLHGLNFGIMGAISVVFINDLATNAGRSYAQSRLSAIGGFAISLGPLVCGWIAERYGIGWMFGAMSGVGALSLALFLLRVQESHPEPESLLGRGHRVLHPFWRLLSVPIDRR